MRVLHSLPGQILQICLTFPSFLTDFLRKVLGSPPVQKGVRLLAQGPLNLQKSYVKMKAALASSTSDITSSIWSKLILFLNNGIELDTNILIQNKIFLKKKCCYAVGVVRMSLLLLNLHLSPAYQWPCSRMGKAAAFWDETLNKCHLT